MTELAVDRVTDQTANEPADTLVLDSDLAAMARLPEWVDSLAARHGIPEKTLFAARLCLEESVSNSIRHGYRGLSGSKVRIHFSRLTGQGWVFTVEDDAPRFNPLEQPELPAISPDSARHRRTGHPPHEGVRHIPRLRRDPTGNRLRIAFAPPSLALHVIWNEL